MMRYNRENTAAIGVRRECFLDGVKLKHVGECDTEEGWVICAVENADGKIFVNSKNEFVTAKLYGTITVKVID